MTRISRARMRSFMRIKDLAERLSSAMALLRKRCARPQGSFTRGRRGCTNAQEYSIAGAPNEPAPPERSAGVLDGAKKGLGGSEPVGPNLGQAIGGQTTIQL